MGSAAAAARHAEWPSWARSRRKMQIRGLTFTGAALVTAYAGAEGNGGGAAGGGANGASMLGQLALIGYAFFFSLQRVRTQASSLMFNAYTVISAANAQPFTALQMPFAALWSLLLIKEPISFSVIAGGSLMLVATLLACTDKKTGAK